MYATQHNLPGQPSPAKRTKPRTCPGDLEGPRIRQVLKEFSLWTQVSGHMMWLYHLQTSCEQAGCPVAECRGKDYSATHGPRSLCESITMFLSYYVPRNIQISTDLEWRQLLVALRCFHLFCVRRQYVREDDVLMEALYRLRRFNLGVIPKRLTCLCKRNWWDSYLHQKAVRNVSDNELDDSNSGYLASTENRSTMERHATMNGNGPVQERDENNRDEMNEPVDGDSMDSGRNRSKNKDKGMGREIGRERDRDGELVDEFGYCRYFGAEELTVTVVQVMPDGWIIKCEEDDPDVYECEGRVLHRDRDEHQVFLHLPARTAQNGMGGMTLTGLQLGLRNGIWRPILREDGSCISAAYPPDELFYY